MAKSILAVDMVSIGLILSEGNIDITLEDVFKKVTEYQTANQRIFGTSKTDFSSAIIRLVFMHTQLVSNFDFNSAISLKFREIIPETLKFNEVYMNDEGEEWLHAINYDDEFLEHCFKIDRKEYELKIKMKESMIEFFKNCNIKPIDSKHINNFMLQEGLTSRLLVLSK